MKKITYLVSIAFSVLMISCGGKEEKKDGFSMNRQKAETSTKKESSTDKASTRIDLKSTGVGPITSVDLEPLDQSLADKGKAVFDANCVACHMIGRKFVGPDLTGVTARRNPAWIMNMILNPEKMIKEDQLAKDLFMEFNGAPMSNQNISQEDARAILEYLRTTN
ncbi:MAG: cytochrome c [Flavobacteriaceae bacterium]|jgi:cytochrome c551/c552|nr:cytochrome c [Flavobacteriaceae bacterium]NVJ72825.1 cytochrome c [Flavobacteriaceae bacterium]